MAVDPNELKPAEGGDPKAAITAADPNELKPEASATDQPTPAPGQVNEIQAADPAATASTPQQDMASDKDIASSKHKKKKGLSKIIPLPQAH